MVGSPRRLNDALKKQGLTAAWATQLWFWRSVKYEEVYLNDYASPRDARLGLAHYFQFYNFERPHQALNYQTPARVYAAKDQAVLYTQP